MEVSCFIVGTKEFGFAASCGEDLSGRHYQSSITSVWYSSSY